MSAKYSLIYVITKLGLLFVYDLETATAVYRNRISPDPIFLTAEAKESGGFYAVNRKGQVLLATVNEQTIVPFVSGQVGGTERQGVREEWVFLIGDRKSVEWLLRAQSLLLHSSQTSKGWDWARVFSNDLSLEACIPALVSVRLFS